MVWCRYILFYLLFTILPATVVYSSLPAVFPEIRLYTTEDGLSQSGITICFTDSRGLLWIGTKDGLNVFYGYGFRVFRHQHSIKTSLSGNYILSIAEDNVGQIWIGTNNGLNLFNRKTNGFTHFVHNPDDPHSMSGNKVYALLPDKNGEIWMTTGEYLERFQPATSTSVKYKFTNPTGDKSMEGSSTSLIRDINGVLWFGTNKGLYAFHPEDEIFVHYVNIPGNPYTLSHNEIHSVFQDSNGELWIGNASGLNKYDRQNDRFIRYVKGKETPGPVYSISEKEHGILWLFMHEGIWNFDKRKSQFTSIVPFYLNKNQFTPGRVTSASVDKSGIVWMGTTKGLIKHDSKPLKFGGFNSSQGSAVRLTDEKVSALLKDRNGLVWAGIWEHGIDVIDRDKLEKVRFYKENPDKKKRLSSNRVTCLLEDPNGLIWIGGLGGIDVYDPITGLTQPMWEKFDLGTEYQLSKSAVRSMSGDKRGNIWVGTDMGVIRFSHSSGYSPSIQTIYDDSLQKKAVSVVHAQDSVNVWIGTESGLFHYNQVKEEITYSYFSEGFSEIFNHQINSIYTGNAGVLWIGTEVGLIFFNSENTSYKLYTQEDGLPGNHICSILGETDSILWLSTYGGLTRFDPVKGEFRNYLISEGLQDYEFNFGAGYSSPDGEFFFGGISGFNYFFPGRIETNTHIPELIIYEITVLGPENNSIVYRGDYSSLTIEQGQTISLSFSALDYTLPEKNRYMYSLVPVGSLEKWIHTGTQNKITYADLGSGEYVFRLRGSNSDGIWNMEGIKLKIYIKSPVLIAPVAIFIYGLLSIALIFWIIQTRTFSLRRANRILRDRDIAARQVQKQKELLSLRNRNIEDSLKYAKRIQMAVLTNQKIFRAILPGSFILHQPKDIVSGDFYWIFEMDDKVFIAAVDCTGHGVPGAFMSIIGFDLFRKIIILQKIYDPAEILNSLNRSFEEIFGGGEGEIVLKDGMDLAFCVIDKKTNMLEFAGAFNPVYIIRDDNLIELKGDRFSVGADSESSDEVQKVFTRHTFQLESADMLYMFSDGYPDQFGGPEGKKFKYRRFRHLLLTIHQLPLEKQKQYLKDSIEEWRGNFEQVDDILVIGIRPYYHY